MAVKDKVQASLMGKKSLRNHFRHSSRFRGQVSAQADTQPTEGRLPAKDFNPSLGVVAPEIYFLSPPNEAIGRRSWRAIALSGLLLLLPCALALGTKAQKTPKAPPVVHRGKLGHRIKLVKPDAINKALQPFAFTGIRLKASVGVGQNLSFRVTLPDDTPAEGAFGTWTPLTGDPTDGSDPSGLPTPPPNAASPPEPADSDHLYQRVPLLPASYNVYFNYPLPTAVEGETAAPLVWRQSVRVKKERTETLEVAIPSLPPDKIVHFKLVKAGPMTPFNLITLEPLDPREPVTSRWDYYLPEGAVLPDGTVIPAVALAGRYRIVLSATASGTFSSLRYEVPEPLVLAGPTQVPFKRPVFHTLKAHVTDRKGLPMPGMPLTLHGFGETFMFLDSGGGAFSVRVPEGRYQVKGTVFGEKRSRDVTFESELDLTRDQEKTWKAPIDVPDFGLAPPTTK